MEVPSGAIRTRTDLLEFEINQFRQVLAEVAEGHYWVNTKTNQTFFELCMPEGVPINMEIEEDLIAVDCKIRGINRDYVEYAGRISPEQALGAIMVRQEAIAAENAHETIGAIPAWNAEKVLL